MATDRMTDDLERRRGGVAAATLATATICAVLVSVCPARAQGLARFSADSVIAVEQFAGSDTGHRLDLMTFDGFVSVRLGGGWQAYVRPVLRRSRPLEWDAQICQAAVRYQRAAAVSVRFDAGYLASPVGLGMLDARANANPVMTPHPNYVTALPALSLETPPVLGIAAIYPLGAVLTVSGIQWDARAAIVDTAPTRVRPVFGADQQRRTPVFEAGAGVTPRAGLRIGVSVARGAYFTPADTAPRPETDRRVTLVSVEGEYSFGHTKMSAEWIRDTFETAGDAADVRVWFVEASQTLTPRWFVAAREEGRSAPVFGPNGIAGTSQRAHLLDANVGYRLTPEITIRAGSLVRISAADSGVGRQFGMSLVWARRWW